MNVIHVKGQGYENVTVLRVKSQKACGFPCPVLYLFGSTAGECSLRRCVIPCNIRAWSCFSDDPVQMGATGELCENYKGNCWRAIVNRRDMQYDGVVESVDDFLNRWRYRIYAAGYQRSSADRRRTAMLFSRDAIPPSLEV